MASNFKETAVKTVIVERKRLQETLATNLEIHKKEFTEAMEGYRAAQADKIRLISKAAQTAVADPTEENRKDVHQAYVEFRDLERPVDNSKSYTQAIRLMEWETREEIELSINDFECYVEDNWTWSRSFKSAHSNYSPSGHAH